MSALVTGTSSHALTAFDFTQLATTPQSKLLSPSLTQPWVPLESRRNVGGGHGGQRAVDQWMQSHPISHAPDIIIRDYDGPNSFVLIDIKTLDAAGSAHIGAHHTDRARLPAHLAIAANSRRHQYGDIAPNMRLVIIAISTCGAINSEGIDFISHLAKRTDNSIPLALLDPASWAAPRLAR